MDCPLDGEDYEAAVASSKEKLSEGSDQAKGEIEKLKVAYENLDERSKLVLRLILVTSGLYVLLAI